MTTEKTMSIHRYTEINPLVNPVKSGDVIIAESGERYIVCQGMGLQFSLKHAKTEQYIGGVYDSQVGICGYIESNFMNI